MPSRPSSSTCSHCARSFCRVPVLAGCGAMNHVSGMLTWFTCIVSSILQQMIIRSIRTNRYDRWPYSHINQQETILFSYEQHTIFPSIPQTSQLSDVLCLNLFQLFLCRVIAPGHMDRPAYHADERISIAHQSMSVIERSPSMEEWYYESGEGLELLLDPVNSGRLS